MNTKQRTPRHPVEKLMLMIRWTLGGAAADFVLSMVIGPLTFTGTGAAVGAAIGLSRLFWSERTDS